MKNLITLLRSWFTASNRYEGATWSRTRSRLPGAVQSARFDASKATRKELIRKSRYFEKNNPIYNRLADIWELYISGAGLNLSPATLDSQWNEAAKAKLEIWSDFCDYTGRQSFATLQSLLARAWFVDGEVFIIKVRGQSDKPRLQVLESHLCETPAELASEEGKSIIDGVKIDKAGRVLGFYFVDDTNDAAKSYRFIDREDLIHLFEPSRPGQYRGIPLCHAVINELHDLDDLHILEMQAAKENSKVARFIQTANGEADDSELLRTGGETADVDGKKRFEHYEETFGADIKVLFPGDTAQQFAGERPSVVTTDYWRYKTELVCAGIGIPYVMVFPDKMQGTVYRGALDMAALFFRARSTTFASVLRSIYVFWAQWARTAEPDLKNFPADWDRVSISTPRAPNVDVGRNSSAMLAELMAGATTYDAVYGPLGLDWRDAFRKLKEQQDYARQIGLVLPSSAVSPQQQQGGKDGA